MSSSAGSVPTPDRARRGRHWALLVTHGLVSVVVGILALVWPGATLLIIAVLFAIECLVTGVVFVVRSFADHGTVGSWRVLEGLIGALSFLVGLLLLREPLRTLAVIALLIGAWWLVSGVLAIVSAFSGAPTDRRAWALVSGAIGVLAGVVVLLLPGISLTVLVIVLGIVLILQGSLAIWGGVTARKLRAA